LLIIVFYVRIQGKSQTAVHLFLSVFHGLPKWALLRACWFPLFRIVTASPSLCKPAKTRDTEKLSVSDSGKDPVCLWGLRGIFPFPDLSGGDFLAAAYEYGTITARKLPPADKYYVVDTQNHGAYIRLNGGWLNDAGFPPDSIAVVSSTKNGITFSAWNGKHDEYPELVKHARKNKYRILQTRLSQKITFMELFSDVLDKVGLKTGDIAGICYEYGKITLFKPVL